jgi:hypothetical protein
LIIYGVGKAVEGGVFDAIPSPDALKQKLIGQQKGKGKTPA